MQSMTGFGSKEAKLKGLGTVSVELRSSNHKFLETVLHVPEGFLSLEEKIKKIIESRMKRGRITCAVTIRAKTEASASINKELLASYVKAFKDMQKKFHLQDSLSVNTLAHLPGVISLEETRPNKKTWPALQVLVEGAVGNLNRMRKAEGSATHCYLKDKAKALKSNLEIIKLRFKKAVEEKLKLLCSDDERSSFLKERDITEEMERLEFHISNFNHKLGSKGAIGKELDFIAQEMQREANTLSAKSFDTQVSARILQMKSQVEKIREQVQNIE